MSLLDEHLLSVKRNGGREKGIEDTKKNLREGEKVSVWVNEMVEGYSVNIYVQYIPVRQNLQGILYANLFAAKFLCLRMKYKTHLM